MTSTTSPQRPGLRGQLAKLRHLAQPFFLPLDQVAGWQFIGLLVALLFCVGGLVLVALTGVTRLLQELVPDLTAKYFGGVAGTLSTIWGGAWGVVISALFVLGAAAFFSMRQQLRGGRWLHWLLLGPLRAVLLC